ncbi:MAG: pyrroloquinoline quinone biosynthesis protein PqqE [Rhodospirillales bacterium]|nr:pyrroloquinoline quinone biosynthesis protein PqqE [Rhodospirillales bacterium]MDH3793289.1 pyrroloquinoline quinone biosynthesis protein PqqE [Rhodospirillales bacterium]MDH3910447.1 pyrroloquinoline quinone biosynthesis protein PqqE [Rhodospirillales bacterium]MDH3920244.1 pyrroloquinoline quinone biosynthesis protein PqqE [Rhodospirillales bacterium]MDH3969585.1 pyrroloquinoline quinone biosynthesis protein PqqE [Rhodospirillales bacterium]
MNAPEPPLAALAELTHRCPLQCPYCSNPLELERAAGELDTETWCRVIREIADLGALQIHFSGGEPLVRKDLERLVEEARDAGLYANLITSAVLLTEDRLQALVAAGIDHVQVSFQDSEAVGGDRIGGYRGAHEKKIDAARRVRAAGLPVTLNMVVHRQNLHHLEAMFDMAVELDAHRIEIAHVQYYGWAYENRAALLPTRAQLDRSIEVVDAARERYKGRFAIDYVVPDYYARRPKACMGGWGRRFLNVSPSGKVLPCHAAETITGLAFDTVLERSLEDIWESSEAFLRFRGTDWMPEPCRSCERRELDWGGCRCQAFAITGNAADTDPACELSPHHQVMLDLAKSETGEAPPDFVYRNYGNKPDRAKTATPAVLTADRPAE